MEYPVIKDSVIHNLHVRRMYPLPMYILNYNFQHSYKFPTVLQQSEESEREAKSAKKFKKKRDPTPPPPPPPESSSSSEEEKEEVVKRKNKTKKASSSSSEEEVARKSDDSGDHLVFSSLVNNIFKFVLIQTGEFTRGTSPSVHFPPKLSIGIDGQICVLPKDRFNGIY